MSQLGPQPPPIPPSYNYGYWPAPTTHRNDLAVAAVILGVAGLVTSWLVIGIGFGIGAVVTGVIARSRAKTGATRNSRLPVVGIVLGVVSIVVGVDIVALVLFLGVEQLYTNDCYPVKQHAGCY